MRRPVAYHTADDCADVFLFLGLMGGPYLRIMEMGKEQKDMQRVSLVPSSG